MTGPQGQAGSRGQTGPQDMTQETAGQAEKAGRDRLRGFPVRIFGRPRSLAAQIACSMVFISFVSLALMWILNTSFLGKFYLDLKVSGMSAAYEQLVRASEEGRLYDSDYQVEFEKLCSNGNLQILVVSSDWTTVLSSQGEDELIRLQLSRSLFGSEGVRLKETGSYYVERMRDNRLEGDFLLLFGSLPDSNSILMRSAMASISDSARVSNRFLLFTGIVSVACAILVSVLISMHITRPLKHLMGIADRMEKLDFAARYPVRKGGNEIDQLGEHVNRMSDALYRAIRDLRQANTDLERDLAIREENEAMRREFLSNVSHELKTPIALISGYAEGLKEGLSDDPEDRDYYLGVIMDEAERMNRMVKELTALNQIEYGKDALSLERINLVELVGGVLEKNRILLEQGGITVECQPQEPPDTGIWVWGDGFLTETVFSNYLSNAIHYAAGEKKIIVRLLYDRDGEEKQVRVEVENTGSPIPEESLPHLWEKFYKVDPARTRKYGGSGIGLSIVRAVCESMKKDYGVRNTQAGVCFWFALDQA